MGPPRGGSKTTGNRRTRMRHRFRTRGALEERRSDRRHVGSLPCLPTEAGLEVVSRTRPSSRCRTCGIEGPAFAVAKYPSSSPPLQSRHPKEIRRRESLDCRLLARAAELRDVAIPGGLEPPTSPTTIVRSLNRRKLKCPDSGAKIWLQGNVRNRPALIGHRVQRSNRLLHHLEFAGRASRNQSSVYELNYCVAALSRKRTAK